MTIPPELKLISDSFKTLKQDGVIRSKNFVGDLGEYYCSELFNLTLNLNVVETGFDAIDKDGKKIEVKTRTTPEGKEKVTFRSFDFDYCLFIELNEYFEPTIILKVLCGEIVKNIDKNKNRLSVLRMRKTTHEVVYKSV